MAQNKAQIHNSITPEELEDARKATVHFNRFFGYEHFTVESYIETMRFIDGLLVAEAHREAMKVIRYAEAVQHRQVVRYDATCIKRRSLIIVSRAPRVLRRQVKASNSSDGDDHDANLSFVPNTKPGYPSRLLSFIGR